MDFEFLDKPIEILPENRITLYRFNYEDSSPWVKDTKWDYTAKAVKANNIEGIYCLLGEMLENDSNLIVRDILGEDIRMDGKLRTPLFLEIEADKNKIIHANQYEISVTECNVIKVSPLTELATKFPIYGEIVHWHNRLKNDNGAFDYYRIIRESTNRLDKKKEVLSDWIYHEFDKTVHGYTHSLRVSRNIKILAKAYGFSGNVIICMDKFAFFHDLYRVNDGHDPGHGKRASEVIKRAKEHSQMSLLNNMDMLEKICFACEHHSTMLRSGDPVIDVCFDADRLDLPRVGVMPEPEKMATYMGMHFAENYDAYMSIFQKFKINWEEY